MVPTLAPDSGNTSGEDCEKDVFFVATTFGTGPFDWEWTIVPAAARRRLVDAYGDEAAEELSALLPA